ncbi:ABC transporter ATP-binding protein [Hafnia paralvei]|uniref:ABC transporter ATP-binding protein n=1 Tax=Hafnia paralvei TaxID=546367 RepID=UPI000DF25B3A|nr:ABC transporter ATP-binding protein [Hafnia paralvei]MDX6912006.1 ABC transporter ATP-binding protein [Hafnia paralvei]RDA61353.1 ABC transporter ATP-binding protein [Hafnia paralvei]RDA62179.1 ABC transporter ATP-binding protein [Hafnia paralvei]RDA62313.1 ABC transporter ATP-binding protein [Hafnia paralvei]RDA74088.1 ABC transporter ATP-binding protein [Hafnia paralvei]
MAMVVFNNVALGYHHQPVLHNVSFTLQRGEMCCLLGANGCGKTTLMRTLLGLLPVLHGEIALAGKPLPQWSAAKLAQKVAYVPQAHNGPFSYNVIDMVTMGRSAHLGLFASPNLRDRQLALDTLETLGIAHLEQRRFPTLSGGERQLVLIARALVQQPELLVMDEPAASLDFGHQITLLKRIRQLKTAGITLLMSTHHPMHAKAVADTIVTLSPQVGALQGTPQQMLNSASLSRLYQVSTEEIETHLGI